MFQLQGETLLSSLGGSTLVCWKGESGCYSPTSDSTTTRIFHPDHGMLDHLYTFVRVLEGAGEPAKPVNMCFVDLEPYKP